MCGMQVSQEDYAVHGAEGLTELLAQELAADGMRPYVVPEGGSSSLGCWGYIMAMQARPARCM